MTKPFVNQTDACNTTSLSLLERVKARDTAAWQRLLDLYTPLVDQWTRQAKLQDADAADVRQDVFLAVSRGIDSFRRDRPGDSFRGWLRTITQNKIADHHRKTRGEPIGVGGADADQHLAETPSQADDDSDNAAVSEEVGILYRRALELVSRDFEERTWQAFWRVVIDGQSPAEVSEALGTSANAVYLAKGRVLARLREEFRDLLDS